jgi:transposase-like protein
MSANTKKTYDDEFKKQAVQLLIGSGRPLTQIARELGVPVWNLRDWRKRLQPQMAQQPETLEAMSHCKKREPLQSGSHIFRIVG